jgi:hypothetical protein
MCYAGGMGKKIKTKSWLMSMINGTKISAKGNGPKMRGLHPGNMVSDLDLLMLKMLNDKALEVSEVRIYFTYEDRRGPVVYFDKEGTPVMHSSIAMLEYFLKIRKG